jgi:hypothetical protein
MPAFVNRLAFGALAALLWASAVPAQEPPKTGDPLQKQMNCPASPAPAMRAGDTQPTENSAILPSAGGHQNSAAPTVQQDGKPVEQRADCPPPVDSKPEQPGGAKPSG